MKIENIHNKDVLLSLLNFYTKKRKSLQFVGILAFLVENYKRLLKRYKNTKIIKIFGFIV